MLVQYPCSLMRLTGEEMQRYTMRRRPPPNNLVVKGSSLSSLMASGQPKYCIHPRVNWLSTSTGSLLSTSIRRGHATTSGQRTIVYGSPLSIGSLIEGCF